MLSMILQKAKTIEVLPNPWTSPPNPDGNTVTIWTIKLEHEGNKIDTINTMSKIIATVGFEGDVEIYENAKGKTYVRKAPSENKPSGGGYQKSPEQEESIAKAVALKAAVEFWNKENDMKSHADSTMVLNMADEFLAWLKDNSAQASENIPEQPLRPWDKLHKPKTKEEQEDEENQEGLASDLNSLFPE